MAYIQSENSLIPNNQLKRRITIIIAICALSAVILGLAAWWIIASPDSSFKNVYFGKGTINRYSLVNIATGQGKDFIPSGYEIVGQHNYNTSPDFVILKKGNELFSYNIISQSLTLIFSSDKGFWATLYPSATEKSKFFIEIHLEDTPRPSFKIDKSLSADLNLKQFVKEASSITFTRQSFFFDASSGKLSLVKNKDFFGCSVYDSKNQRFFVWHCDSNDASLLPFYIADLTGKKIKEVISAEDFNFAPSDLTLNYGYGFFIIASKYDFSEIIAFNYNSPELTKEIYRVSDKIQGALSVFLGQTAKQDKYYPHSLALVKDSNAFAVSGNQSILLLRFNSAKEITDYKVITEKAAFSGSFFIYKDKFYWQSGDSIKVMDLDNWRLVKTLDSKSETFGSEINLFILPSI